jgi:hypothetical protein
VGQSPEELRGDIARTREELSGTLDAIEDRVSPSRIVERRKEQVRSRLSGIKESVMGSADDMRESAGDFTGQMGERLSGAGDRLSDVPQAARRNAQGNPFAAGLIAFGAGLLVAALFPGTETEGQLAQKVQEVAQPVTEQARQAGTDMMSSLQEPLADAAQHLKETAAAGVSQVKDTALQAGDDTKQSAAHGVGQVTDQARESTQAVRGQS